MVRDHGLAITLFQPFRDFEGLPEPQRSRAFDRAERKFDLMQELGTDLMLVCSNVSPLALGGIDRAAADFRELGERAAQRGLRVGYEALAWGRHVSDHRDAWEDRAAGRPSQCRADPRLLPHAGAKDRRRIRSARFPATASSSFSSPTRRCIDMDLLYWSRHFRNMPGEGDLPVLDFMRAVAATGYDGPLSLEIFNDQFRGGSPEVDRRRWPALAHLPDGPGAARRAGARHRRSGHARPDRRLGRRIRRVRRQRRGGRGPDGAPLHDGLLACRTPQAPGRERLEARRWPRHQPRHQHRA